MEYGLLLNDIDKYKGKYYAMYDFLFANADENGLHQALRLLEIRGKKEITHLYFGTEFCEFLIPAEEQIEKWLKICREDDLYPVFVTPVASDYGINRLKTSLELIEQMNPNTAIVINDLGVLQMIKSEYPLFDLIVGRVLDKTSHDSRASIISLNEYYGDEGLKYAKTPGNISSEALNVYRRYGISRFEYDLSKCGISLDNNNRYSLYWPFSYLTTGRICLFKSIGKEYVEKFLVNEESCNCVCKDFELEMRKPLNEVSGENRKTKHDLYVFQKGNTIFYISDDIDEQLKQFDRIVVQLM